MRVLASLFALTAVACWHSSTAEPPPTPTTSNVRTSFTASSCSRDSIVETVCGRSAAGCERQGNSLLSIDTAEVFVTEAGTLRGSALDSSQRAAFRDFVVDRGATSRFRESLRAEEEVPATRSDAQCCYSRCTKLVVGDPGPARPALPLPTPEQCIPRPPAGTSLAAPHDRGCPLGVEIERRIRHYVQTVDDRCCYDMRS